MSLTCSLWNHLIGCAALGAAFLSLSPQACLAQEEEVDPLVGPVLLLFDDDKLGNAIEGQFGIFRSEDDLPRDQYIEDVHATIQLPGAKSKTGLRCLLYVFGERGRFNGFWIKLGGANWTAYENGELIFLLRQLHPAVDSHIFGERGVEAGKDTPATDRFKVELKTKSPGNAIRTVGIPILVKESQKEQQAQKGFFEVRIPLKNFALNLSKSHELVIVFESSRIPKANWRGGVGMRGVLISKTLNQRVDEIIANAADSVPRN